jgi:gamma-glutamyl hercynylcysteine S-oxide synthase
MNRIAKCEHKEGDLMLTRLTGVAIVLALLCPAGLSAQDTRYPRFGDEGQQIPGPPKPEEFSTWLAELQRWRRERVLRVGYDSSEYGRPELQWSQRSFIQPQMMVEDRYFFDLETGRYTVDRYLDDLEHRYGGIDSVLIWPVYPNIGIDNRNQRDLLRDMPGGIAGLRAMVDEFHRRGVRVLFPIMPWDQGTREEREPYWKIMAGLMAEIGADGLNGDTMHGVPRVFRTASDQAGWPLTLEPEHAPQSDEALAWNNMSWGYWTYSFIPSISSLKWLEPRHMINICRRWGRDKNDDLQHAFFNGVGYESWENIWGIWNQITPRDAEALRRVSKIERAVADLLVSSAWEPHTPTLQFGVFASKFPTQKQRLWTLVNRNEYDTNGSQLRVLRNGAARYWDLWHGVELTADVKDGQAALAFEIEAKGYGAVLETGSEGTGAEVQRLMAQMKSLSQKRLSEYSAEWKFLPQRLVEIAPTRSAQSLPAGMLRIPAGVFEFQVSGIEIEGSNDVGVDVQYPWENLPRRHHRKTIDLKSFYIDQYPVTNSDFKKFLDASGYRPKDDHNFLRDWKNGRYPDGWGKKPVTWVSLEDARAYAAWAGKRLPHEWEWQYAAQGSDGRAYPWGNEWKTDAVPLPDQRRDMREPTDVDAFPTGVSPFGARDLVGNVWQWTDEYQDEHTRAAILRGGSYYQSQGSKWYFPQAYKLTEHGKYLLMAPGKDRSGALGFRCVVDAE